MLTSFDTPVTAVVIGASGGIGQAFVGALAADPSVVKIYSFSRSQAVSDDPKIIVGHLDLEDETSIKAAAQSVDTAPCLVLVATGLLHDTDGLMPEKSWRAITPEAMHRLYSINTIGPALVAKHFLPLLPRRGKSVFAAISARVGSISDNRKGGWHGYRASKAALNMMIKNFAIELALKRKEALCIGLHPGTVDTNISSPFQKNVPADQLFSPAHSAASLLQVIDSLGPEATGACYDYAGALVPS